MKKYLYHSNRNKMDIDNILDGFPGALKYMMNVVNVRISLFAGLDVSISVIRITEILINVACNKIKWIYDDQMRFITENKRQILMKKINYKVADAVLLLILFLTVKLFGKYAFGILKSNKDSILIAIGVSLILFSLCINRFFFRPSHKEIVRLWKKGWGITGYYSRLSLSNEEIYHQSYRMWLKYSFIFLLVELSGLFMVYGLNNCFLTTNMFFTHVTMSFISPIVAWIITRIKEKKYEK